MRIFFCLLVAGTKNVCIDWGKLGKLFEEKRKKRWFQAQKRAKTAIFREVNLPLTPSFVGSNPATPAKLDSVEHLVKEVSVGSFFVQNNGMVAFFRGAFNSYGAPIIPNGSNTAPPLNASCKLSCENAALPGRRSRSHMHSLISPSKIGGGSLFLRKQGSSFGACRSFSLQCEQALPLRRRATSSRNAQFSGAWQFKSG